MEKEFVPSPFPFVRCDFNEKTDLHETDQVGYIDLNKVFETGVIEGAASFDDNSFNGILDPADILPRPHDSFERIRQGEYVRSALAASSAKPEPGQSKTE